MYPDRNSLLCCYYNLAVFLLTTLNIVNMDKLMDKLISSISSHTLKIGTSQHFPKSFYSKKLNLNSLNYGNSLVLNDHIYG